MHKGQQRSLWSCWAFQQFRPFLVFVSFKWPQLTVKTWIFSRWAFAFHWGEKISASHLIVSVSFAESKTAACLLDKFTEVGLRKHLLQNGGEGLLMNEEMENTLRHIYLEEFSTFCWVFDGDLLYIDTGRSNSRWETERSSLALGRFMGVRNSWPYIVTHHFDEGSVVAIQM